MNNWNNTPLCTDRLTIRPIEASDWVTVREIWMDFQRSPYVLYDNFKNTDPADVKPRIARWAEHTRSGREHMFLAPCLDGQMIGYIALNRRDYGYELAYGFLTRYQGRGYARESIRAVLNRMPGKICAGTALKNEPSVRLLRSLGFSLVGTEQLSFHRDARGQDIVFEGGIFEWNRKETAI